MIGIFDSGSGGLTVYKEIRRMLPKADLIYLGDIANAPYGLKTQKELSILTKKLINKLVGLGANRIVSACNSISASVLAVEPLNILEMVGPTVKDLQKNKREIFLAATIATVESGIYQNSFKKVGKEITAISVPDLAGAIEFGKSNKDIDRIIRGIKSDILKERKTGKQILILGCTHYPLVMDRFEKIFEDTDIQIYNPAVAVAKEVKREMKEHGDGKNIFLVTKDSKIFKRFVLSQIGGKKILIKTIKT